MADSPNLPPPTPEQAPPVVGSGPAPASPPPVPAVKLRAGLGSGLHTLWTLVVRLVILGVGVSVGWLVGLLVAQVFPARNLEPPLMEVALRRSSQTARKVRQLPGWWQGDGTIGLPPVEADVATDASGPGASGPDSPAPAEEASVAEPLNDENRDRIAADLTTLQQDLAQLNTQLAEIETSLGTAPTGTVEDRLQRLNQRLAVDSPAAEGNAQGAEAEPAAETAPVAETVALSSYQEPRFPLVRDRVVLPNALLFAPGSSTLTDPGQQLLDSIAPDLRRYGVATLVVGSHASGTASPERASQLTLQQALAVQQYLAPQLEGSGSRWVTVGYGTTRPLVAGTTAADQQRNQRIEIGIVPGG